MYTGASWKPILIITMIVLVILSIPAYAYTQHNPVWYTRPRALNRVLDNAIATIITTGNLYVIHDTVDPTTSYNEIGVTVHSLTDGSMLDSTLYSYTGQGDFYGGDAITLNGRLFIAGTIVDSTTGAYGVLLEIDPYTLNIVNQYSLDETGNGYDTVFTGLCSDSSGYVYAVGRQIDQGNHTIFMLVAQFDFSQGTISWVRLKANGQSGLLNITGYSCTVDANNDLYVSGLLYHYSQQTNSLYSDSLALIKLSTLNLSILNYHFLPLWNSQGWVIGPQKNDIIYSSGNLIVAFTYADELPDPNNPTYGASIAAFNSQLQLLWRKNYTTSYDEGFNTIALGNAGWFVVGGWTYNDMGTGLGTTYRHGLLMVFDNVASPTQAFIYGASDNSSRIMELAVDRNGYVYSVGYDYSDVLTIYDVTQEVIPAISNVGSPQPVNMEAQVNRGLIKVQHQDANYTISIEESGSLSVLMMKAIKKVDIVLPHATPSGASSSLIIAYDYQAVTPPPVPEPDILVMLTVIAALAVVVIRYGLLKV